jgi:Raf kinase inhibitor-like YbhB/YbcL family protein
MIRIACLLSTTLSIALGASAAAQPPALDDVVVTGKVAEARTILKGGVDVNAKDQDGVTALMRAASAGRGDMVGLLIASGADVHAKTSGGVTAVMMASLGGYVTALEPLLAAKADPNIKDNQGRTALMAAASSGDRRAVDALLQAGADVKAADAGGSTALTYAAAEGNAGAVDALQRRGAKAGEGEMVLAAGRCNTAIVASFLTAGMSVNATEAGAASPLFVAAGGNCVDTVDLLIARGANVNATNGDGWTPLIKAAAAGHTDVVRRLLVKGADMNVADQLGRTAWMYAAMANREEMAELFRQARAAQRASTPIEVTSPGLTANQPMSREYTADGHNVSPPLAWSKLPEGTASIAVVCEDPDAGNPPPFVHWVMYNIPASATGLPENIPFEPNAPMPADLAGAIQGLSGFRRPFYRGPAPPPGKPHHYHFVVYALDLSGLPPGLTRADLLDAIKDHVLGTGEIVATYERTP